MLNIKCKSNASRPDEVALKSPKGFDRLVNKSQKEGRILIKNMQTKRGMQKKPVYVAILMLSFLLVCLKHSTNAFRSGLRSPEERGEDYIF